MLNMPPERSIWLLVFCEDLCLCMEGGFVPWSPCSASVGQDGKQPIGVQRLNTINSQYQQPGKAPMLHGIYKCLTRDIQVSMAGCC